MARTRKDKGTIDTLKRYGLYSFKLLSAFFVAVFIALVAKAVIGYGNFSFMFVFLTVFFAFLKLIKKYYFLGTLFTDLLFVFFVALMGAYIHLADKALI